MEDPESEAKIEFPETDPASPLEKLQWEKETLGMYVSSHPLAGLKKYIGKKAQLIGNLTQKEVGKKVKLAGIQEGIKKITTKKGDTMAILFLEDPTGKIEVTLFPRTYAEVAEHIEDANTFLVIDGALDLRAGQLQVRADSIKSTKLTRVIDNAKKSGFYDEEEAKNGIRITRAVSLEDNEIDAVDAIDEEGNVIAGETITVEKKSPVVTEELVGPIAKWISDGMPVDKIMSELGLLQNNKEADEVPNPKSQIPNKTNDIQNPQPTTPNSKTQISVYTIDLPERAPKKMLLDLKHVLETFPGKEKVQLKIGEQTVSLPLTISTSTILEKKIAEVMEKYVTTTL